MTVSGKLFSGGLLDKFYAAARQKNQQEMRSILSSVGLADQVDVIVEKLFTTKWREVHIGVVGDDVELGGVRLWSEEWRSTMLAGVELPHPAYRNQIDRFEIYEVGSEPNVVRFAAAELSNGVWGFYAPLA